MRIVRFCRVRVSLAVACALVVVPAATRAEQQTSSPVSPPPVLETSSASLIAQLPLPQRPQTAPVFPQRPIDEPQRPRPLMPLYASLVALEGLDIHSTRKAIASGRGREANPAMSPMVRNSAAFLAVKLGATAGVIWASEKMWKKNRKASVLFATAVNVAMAAIVANNYRVSR